MEGGAGPAGPLRALQTSFSRACNELGGKLHSMAEQGEQHRQSAFKFVVELGQRAGEQARRLQHHHQQHQQHALAGFAVRPALSQLCISLSLSGTFLHRCTMHNDFLHLLTHKACNRELAAYRRSQRMFAVYDYGRTCQEVICPARL